MKLLIFFLIFLLLFTPTVIAETVETTFSINVQVLDLSGRPIPGLRFALIDHNGVERGSGITTSGKDGNIPGKVESFGTTQNINDETMNGYPLEMVIFYYNGPVADKPENRGRYLEIIGSSKRCFENTTKNYTIYVNELNDEPAAVVMYNMTNTSLSLAEQSKETADESYNLSMCALKLTFISLGIALLSLFIALFDICYHESLLVDRIQRKRQQYKYRYKDSDYINCARNIIFIFLIISIIGAIKLRLNTEGYDLWTVDTAINVFLGFLILSFTIDKLK